MTDADKAKAKQIVDSWYWQPDSWRRKSFVRFYESAPMSSDIFKLVLDYLKSETATSIVMAGKLIELGETWKATDAWYQTMPAEKWQGTESTKVRVYQAFRAESDTSAGPYSVENGCQYAVTHQFHWDVAEIPAVPASSSGVSYALQGVVRDRETGLYSCVLECRTRVQQDVPEYFTSKTIFEEQKEASHFGVKQQNVAGTGKQASVSSGTTVRRKVTKNADCTSDVQNETTVDKPVPDAAETVTELAAGTRTTTEKRNMPAKAPASGLAPGESVRNEKTSSGLWNQTIVRFARDAFVWIGEKCRKTLFVHVHDKTTNVKDKPSFDHVIEAANGKIVEKSVRKTDDGYMIDEQETVEKPVSSAAVEVRRTLRGTSRTVTDRNQSAPLAMTGLEVGEQRRSQKTDGGLYDNTTVTNDAQPAGNIGESCERSSGQHTHTTTTNVADKPSVEVGGASPNQVVRKRASETEQGTWDLETTTTTLNPATATATGGSAGGTETVESGINAPSAPSETGGVNEDVSVSVTPNDHGTVSYQKRKRTFNPATKTATGGSPGVIETVESGTNATSVSSSPGGVNEDVSVSVTPNDHGSVSYQKRTRKFNPATATATSHLKTETRVTKTTQNSKTPTATASQGSASAQPNGMGGANIQVTEVTPHPVDSGWITWDSETKLKNGIYKYHHGLRVFRNLSSPPTPDKGSNCSLNCAVNAYGLYDGSMTYSDLYAWQENSGGGGTDGGSQAGTFTFYEFKQDATGRRKKRQGTVSVRTYYGRGNEGSEAEAAANGVAYPGLHLPFRTYATGAPVLGQWFDDI